jgi:hypothetical protein
MSLRKKAHSSAWFRKAQTASVMRPTNRVA